MIERIPAQIIYVCDRCRMRESHAENERLRADHPLHRWVMVAIMSAVESSTRERERLARHAYLCRNCVREIGQPVDETTPPAKT
jgi:protein-arginine kinase activator protein McsA